MSKFIFIISTTKCAKKCPECQHTKQSTNQKQLAIIRDYFVEDDTRLLTGYGEPIRQSTMYENFSNVFDYGIISRTAFNQPYLAYRYPTVIVPVFATDHFQRVGIVLASLRYKIPNVGVLMFISNNNDIEYLKRLLPWIVKCNCFLIPNITNIHRLAYENVKSLIKYLEEYSPVLNTSFIDMNLDIISSYLIDAYECKIKCSQQFIKSLNLITIAANRYIKPCPFLPHTDITTDIKALKNEFTNTFQKFCQGCNWIWPYILERVYEYSN